MAVTRSTAAERAQPRTGFGLARRQEPRWPELLFLLAGSVLLLAGLVLVYQAKTATPADTPQTFNLRQLERREQLLPVLTIYNSPADRQFAARKIFEYITDHGNALPNVGALGRIHITGQEVLANGKLDTFARRLPKNSPDASIPLFTASQLAQLKPTLRVRDMSGYRRTFLLWTALFFAGFYLVHLGWRLRGVTGEPFLLPVLHLLTGIGLILMVTLRDPLRDTMMFVNFSQGVVAGCVLLLVLSLIDYERLFGGLSFVPLLGALALSVALILFGSGPGSSDAKVNLLGIQPVELIKILLVFFLAGYFARRWEFLRELREKRPSLAHLSKYVEIPRLEYVLPVLAAIGLMLGFFFLQRDLGPALVFSCVFLALYAVARNKAVLSIVSLLLLVGGFATGYWLGHPRTVSDRVSMWLSPWNNSVHGGDQVVHSLWAMASGGPFGAGIGLGEPGFIPAGHTDLVLAVLGEEWGLIGIITAFLLFGLLIWLGLRIARRAPTDYTFFLALGLTLLLSLELLLISGGILDLVPLSGVVTPFLSYGRTAMLANFIIAAILISISSRASRASATAPFTVPVRYLTIALGVMLAIVVGRAAMVQTIQADTVTGNGALIVQADGGRRYVYNPRLMEIARSIPRGSIYDRNGLPLATSDWKVLTAKRAQLVALGIDPDKALDRNDTRYYPFGPATFHLLGDVRSRLNWAASNSSLQERDSAITLQGYDDRARVVEVTDPSTGKPAYTIRYDYRELLPLLRHRQEPNHPAVKRVLDRNRDVRMSLDARLQLRVTQILRDNLKRLGRDRGAVVVMDVETGDLLASVNEPVPTLSPQVHMEGEAAKSLLDRARYGLYPPGSTFKVVTAMAALRVNPELANQTYDCVALPDGRVGNFVGNSRRPIRDDVQDRSPHGTLAMEKGMTVSCNAYFAQLGTYKVGAQALFDTANLLGISTATPAKPEKLKEALPQASYGQGQVVASPFQMARVAATIAADGRMPYGRWVTDESNNRVQPPQAILSPDLSRRIGSFMRSVVTNGTGRRLATAPVPVAGKTGTAELADDPSHAWFIGYAPYGQARGRRIAFAVLVENGQYGGTAAAPIAADVVAAAQQLGLFAGGESK